MPRFSPKEKAAETWFWRLTST